LSSKISSAESGYADPGFVYLLTNVAMPGYVKIGLTRHDDIDVRLRQLYTTSLPHPFECLYAARVPDCGKLERVLHEVFQEKRANPKREFFTANPDLARLIIDLVKIEDKVVTDAEQGISPDQRAAIETEKAKRAPNLNFERLGLQVGTVLTHIKDPSITCEVAGPSKVIFQGETMSPSASALKALHQLGFDWPTVSGFDMWTHGGVKLSALRTTNHAEGAAS
jgi:T5orf172 domain